MCHVVVPRLYGMVKEEKGQECTVNLWRFFRTLSDAILTLIVTSRVFRGCQRRFCGSHQLCKVRDHNLYTTFGITAWVKMLGTDLVCIHRALVAVNYLCLTARCDATGDGERAEPPDVVSRVLRRSVRPPRHAGELAVLSTRNHAWHPLC